MGSCAEIEAVEIIDGNITSEKHQMSKALSSDDSENPKGNTQQTLTSNKRGIHSLENTSGDFAMVSPVPDSGIPLPEQQFFLDSVTGSPQLPLCVKRTCVKLKRSLSEVHELEKSRSLVYLTKESQQLSGCPENFDNSSMAPEYMVSRSTNYSNETQLNFSVEKLQDLVETPQVWGQAVDSKEKGCTQFHVDDTNSLLLQNRASSNCILNNLPLSVPKTEDLGDSDDLSVDSPVDFDWRWESDVEEENGECKNEVKFRSTSREERRFVCPVTLRKLIAAPVQGLGDNVEMDDGFGAPRQLCQKNLSLVYSTIEEQYSEGTLQLLSDLLQPGFYPPKDITSHLLQGILLDHQCPLQFCVQAFNLLMTTQRYHIADTNTVPWDWELLTSVVANQDNSKGHCCEVVRMLLEYVVQTLEDDYQVQLSHSALQQSVAKATLSCYLHFDRVRDVIRWLFAAIMKSTVSGEGEEIARERDEYIRMVSIFQRMLSLALEVDCSPTLSSVKLSQELFQMFIYFLPLRAHRMLLLESLKSKLLSCKLLEYLLDYACPQKIHLPMSLSLLLNFLKNCTLKPDPEDGAERWKKWDELVQLLWMLLLSYNKVVRGHLRYPVTDRNHHSVIQTPHDILSRPAVREAVESFLSRSQADIGNTLPPHVEESLTYLQDHLLDVCQC